MTNPSDVTPPAVSCTTSGSEASASGPFAPVGGYGEGDGFRFSARTCLALLPLLDEQTIDNEITFLGSYNVAPPSFRPRTIEGKREMLKLQLCSTLCAETDKIVQNFDSLRASFSDALRNQLPTEHVTDSAPPFSDFKISQEADPGNLPEPVSVLNDIDFVDVDTINFLDSIKSIPTQRMHGNRQVSYMGKQAYSYGRHSKHLPADYPDNPIIDNIFEKLSIHDSTFTKTNFSCLITLYRDGKSYISPHSDNEQSIVDGSNIYTVSFGATRTVLFTHEVGRVALRVGAKLRPLAPEEVERAAVAEADVARPGGGGSRAALQPR